MLIGGMGLPLPPVCRTEIIGLEFSGQALSLTVEVVVLDFLRIAVADVSGVQLLSSRLTLVKPSEPCGLV